MSLREHALSRFPESQHLFDMVDVTKRQQAGKHPNPNYCKMAEWYGLKLKRGPIGVKYFFLEFAQDLRLSPRDYDLIYRALIEDLPRCVAGRLCDCRVDYYVAPISEEQKQQMAAGTLCVWERGMTSLPESQSERDIDTAVDELVSFMARNGVTTP